MSDVYLLLGSNQQQPLKQLAKAIVGISKHIGQIKRQSAIYQTAAWGNTNQPNFLNQIIIVETIFTPQQTLQKILSIEKKMGRVRTVKNAPRIIDIDIIFFNKQIINQDDLIIPHPLLQQRNFVLTPLNELSPNLKHPVLQKTIHQLLRICTDKLAVTKITANKK